MQEDRSVRRWLDRGWEAIPVLLFDEEGVEGWQWLGPDGEEYTSIGDHMDPPTIPDELEALKCAAETRASGR